MKNVSVFEATLVTLAAALLGYMAAGLVIGSARMEQKAAIEAGVGKWVINPTNGVRTFVYGKWEEGE